MAAVDVTRRERTDVFDVKANKDLSCLSFYKLRMQFSRKTHITLVTKNSFVYFDCALKAFYQ